ncbi:LOW QUALITY PROTEIN: uncharacterized protein ACNLHF_011392 [Anomaloglossus baeobatrachus]
MNKGCNVSSVEANGQNGKGQLTSTKCGSTECSAGPLQLYKQRSSESTEAKPQLNPAATSFGTSHPFTPGSPYAPGASRVVVATSGEKSDMSEFARFMVSRELINTSLTKFDDRAESYRAWKATFKAAIANLNFTAEQELDLLIKWLGPGSTNRIKSLRTVYVGQAEAGLAAAWQRLEHTFGSAEAIEKALFKRLQDIPKINLKEVHKLQDLSDLLMELELAKRDPRLSGLCYLDTAHGVNPIVVKLPYSLQEKWATSVSRYKRMNDVTFPPFIQFCKSTMLQYLRASEVLMVGDSPDVACATGKVKISGISKGQRNLDLQQCYINIAIGGWRNRLEARMARQTGSITGVTRTGTQSGDILKSLPASYLKSGSGYISKHSTQEI